MLVSVHKDPYENIYCVIAGYKDFLLIPPSDAPWVPYKKYAVASYNFSPQPTKETSLPDDITGESFDNLNGKSSPSGSSDVQCVGYDTGKTKQTSKVVDQLFNESNSCACGYTSNVLTLDGDRVSGGPPAAEACRSSTSASPECPLFSVVPDAGGSTVPWVSVNPLNPDLSEFPQYRRARGMKVRVEAGDALYLPSLWFHHVTQSHACIAVNYWYDMNFDIKYNYYQSIQALTWKNTLDYHEDDGQSADL